MDIKKNTRSITQRIGRAKSNEVKLEICLEWSALFRADLEKSIKLLVILKKSESLSPEDLNLIEKIELDLKAITKNKAGALKNVFNALLGFEENGENIS